MDTPQTVFRQVLEETKDPLAAFRAIRKKFGLSVEAAKEVWLQANGAASSLTEHQECVVKDIEQILREEKL